MEMVFGSGRSGGRVGYGRNGLGSAHGFGDSGVVFVYGREIGVGRERNSSEIDCAVEQLVVDFQLCGNRHLRASFLEKFFNGVYYFGVEFLIRHVT